LAVFFLASANPEQIEWFSLLGPLTRLSVFPREWVSSWQRCFFADIANLRNDVLLHDQPSVWKTYFAKPDERSKGDVEANQEGLRGSLVQLQDELFKVYNAIIRASPESREDLLDFIGTVVNRNVKRSGMRVDPKTVASDGFMVNLQAILLRLFEPVLDVTYSKLDRIDVGYYTRSKRVDVTEETKIKATQTEYNDYRAEVEAGGSATTSKTSSPFISDLFFLLNAYQHVGMNKTISNRERASKNIHEIRKDLRRLEAERPSWGSGTPQALQGEAAIQRFKSDIDVLRSSVAAYDTQLLSREFIQRNIQFLCFSMTWLIRLVDPTHRYPVSMIQLPLPAEAPVQFKMMPEYLIENVAEYLEFIIRWADPNTLEKSDKDTIVTFILTFLSPNYVNNPFLKAKFMGILAAGVQPTGYFRRGILYETLIYHPLASHHLMPTLVRFFIDVEITGASTQFYDKFNIRRDIDTIFKAMWDNPIQREAFVQARRDDFELFIRFVNMLMSDTTYHLDESLSKLAAIHNVQQAMANQEEWNARPESERKDLHSQLQQAESSAPFHTHSGRSHIQLIKEFTATTKEPFLTPEIVDRLAATLDENLVTLVGPKMQDLKVAEPEKFAFKPKELLADIAQIYINLGESPEFIRAVANDGRSYSKATFEKLARILKNRAILIDHEIESLLTFIAKVEDVKATIEIEDEREIPDEFLGRFRRVLRAV
jgi:ubiquitin conjugation factor E4 B